jgi:hypothetical protein
MLASSLTHLAWTAVIRGDYHRAAIWLREGLANGQYSRYSRVLRFTFLTAAVLSHAAGQPGDAVRLITAADAADSQAGEPIPGTRYSSVRDEQLRGLRGSLGDAAFAAAWAEGQALSFDAAFALARAALDETAGAGTRLP